MWNWVLPKATPPNGSYWVPGNRESLTSVSESLSESEHLSKIQNSGWMLTEREPTSGAAAMMQWPLLSSTFMLSPPHLTINRCTMGILLNTHWMVSAGKSFHACWTVLLQEHLCLVICFDACIWPLTASSSRCPSPGHLLLVSVLVEISLFHCNHFSTALCIL